MLHNAVPNPMFKGTNHTYENTHLTVKCNTNMAPWWAECFGTVGMRSRRATLKWEVQVRSWRSGAGR